jgi:rubrerythrin
LTVIQGTEEFQPQEQQAMPHPPSRPRPKAELRCLDCGYGAVTRSDELVCPMCGGETWDFAEWRPFSS